MTWLCLCVILASCSSDDTAPSPSVTTHTYKVAVLMHSDELARWQQTAQWALQNIAEAQEGMSDRVQLELTYKNQDDPDIAAYMEEIAKDTSIVAIIGPTMSVYAERSWR